MHATHVKERLIYLLQNIRKVEPIDVHLLHYSCWYWDPEAAWKVRLLENVDRITEKWP